MVATPVSRRDVSDATRTRMQLSEVIKGTRGIGLKELKEAGREVFASEGLRMCIILGIGIGIVCVSFSMNLDLYCVHICPDTFVKIAMLLRMMLVKLVRKNVYFHKYVNVPL